MVDSDTECDNCNFACEQCELDNNMNGFCDCCQRWNSCIHTDKNICRYFNDSTNYNCRECKKGINFELDISRTIEYKQNEIIILKRDLKFKENELLILKTQE